VSDDRPEKLAAGHFVRGFPAEESQWAPGGVRVARVMLRTPSGQPQVLTPNEARDLAELLIAEADHADPKGYRA